jgi:hypothetical protein
MNEAISSTGGTVRKDDCEWHVRARHAVTVGAAGEQFISRQYFDGLPRLLYARTTRLDRRKTAVGLFCHEATGVDRIGNNRFEAQR